MENFKEKGLFTLTCLFYRSFGDLYKKRPKHKKWNKSGRKTGLIHTCQARSSSAWSHKHVPLGVLLYTVMPAIAWDKIPIHNSIIK